MGWHAQFSLGDTVLCELDVTQCTADNQCAPLEKKIAHAVYPAPCFGENGNTPKNILTTMFYLLLPLQ